jgi:hypothetical protein
MGAVPGKLCHIVGIGTRSPDDITLACLERIARAEAVVTHIDASALAPIFARTGDRPLLSLRSEYRDDRPRIVSQDCMMVRFLEHFEAYETVAYVTYGTPFLYDSLSVKIRDHCAAHAIATTVTAGVSSIDHVLAITQRDIVPRFEIVDADWLVRGDVPVSPSRAYLLMQPSVFGTRQARVQQPPRAAALEPLAAALMRTHPASHPICFVHAAANGADRTGAYWTCLSELAQAPDRVLLSACLYLPDASSIRSK